MPISHTFDYLPANVLTLSGYEFFQFIKSTLGEPEASLLKKLSISTTASFLATDDPLDIFNYDIEDEDFEKLKDQLSFKLKNQKSIIKPGVISGFCSLKDAFKKKADEELLRPKKRKQQLSNINSSFISLSTTTASSIALSTAQATATTKKLSLDEHKVYALKFIKKWCYENKENLGLENFTLEENKDFTLNIEFDENSNVKGGIICECGKSILLGKNDNKIQVSNYYKHLQSTGCGHMKKIKKAARDLKSMQQQQQSSTSAPFTSSQSQTSLTDVPAVPPTTTATTSHNDSEVLAISASSNGKRRLTSQSQQHHSSKRSRV